MSAAGTETHSGSPGTKEASRVLPSPTAASRASLQFCPHQGEALQGEIHVSGLNFQSFSTRANDQE